MITYDKASMVISHEENSKLNAVKGLSFEASSSLGFINIDFFKGEKTRLSISSDDRDLALLLSADVKEYLKSEVLINRFAFIGAIARYKLTFPIIFMMGMLPMLYGIISAARNTIKLPPHPSDSQKLDYLVSSSERVSQLSEFNYYGMLIPISVVLFIIIIIADIVYVGDTFYFGKEITGYDNAKALKGKIFWGIVVALAVSLIASLISNRW